MSVSCLSTCVVTHHQVVLKKAHNSADIADDVNNKMIEFANRGFRSLGIAMCEGDGKDGETKWVMLGLLPLFDPPRHDTKQTIERCHQQVGSAGHFMHQKALMRVVVY